jgi:hypothetical protein
MLRCSCFRSSIPSGGLPRRRGLARFLVVSVVVLLVGDLRRPPNLRQSIRHFAVILRHPVECRWLSDQSDGAWRIHLLSFSGY